ncbi:pseudouridylate synthase 1 homolog [Saccoglossus kowalevskii]|uniref:tRNA pseudouridine synthase A, mitochondrial-like n=1 Tax=Saccoglossus kowalevskii TaxID=10224 RepID=A0ABM0M5D3_SACKO|nr:PREDICTED: tRNA pseudouridine synthase A, mitochondrial-like [Saccoglossus kowalevskii]
MAESGSIPVVGEKRPVAEDNESDVVIKKQRTEKSVSDTAPKETVQNAEQNKRKAKRKVVLLLSYSGKGYMGMQRNKGVETIEGDLIKAIVTAGAVPQSHADIPQKMQFQRCARTDKGVSAVRQVVSLKMMLVDNAVEQINNSLPPSIRVITYKRTTGGFNAKNTCSHRTYSYLMPTFALSSNCNENYRVTDEVHQKAQDLLNCYKGTHNFHNFTSGKAFTEQSAMRFMRELNVSQAFVRCGLEFVVITIIGQSFMIHQIRKMIGLVIAIIRGVAPKSTLDKCWEAGKMDIPKAPSLGLMLENVHFDGYNKRYGNDGIHEALTWEQYEETIGKFKEEHIYPSIIETEIKEKSMMKWLTSLPLHTYDTRDKDSYRAAHLNINTHQQSEKTAEMGEKEEVYLQKETSPSIHAKNEESVSVEENKVKNEGNSDKVHVNQKTDCTSSDENTNLQDKDGSNSEHSVVCTENNKSTDNTVLTEAGTAEGIPQ